MSTTEGLNPHGLLSQYLLKRACALLQDDKGVKEALYISALMLLEPRLSTLHRAGFHLVLAFSEENFLGHAQRAVELYQQLPDGPQINEVRQYAQAVLDQSHKYAASMKALEEVEVAKKDVRAALNEKPQPQLTQVEVDVATCIREAKEECGAALHEAEDGPQEPGDLSEDDSEPEKEESRTPSGSNDLSGDVVHEEIYYPRDLERDIFKDDDPEDEMSKAERETDHQELQAANGLQGPTRAQASDPQASGSSQK